MCFSMYSVMLMRIMLSSLSNNEAAKCAGEFGFAYARGTEENEGADGATRIFEPGRGTNNGNRNVHESYSFILADDTLMEDVIEAKELFLFSLREDGYRNAGPARDYFGDFVGSTFSRRSEGLRFACTLLRVL